MPESAGQKPVTQHSWGPWPAFVAYLVLLGATAALPRLTDTAPEFRIAFWLLTAPWGPLLAYSRLEGNAWIPLADEHWGYAADAAAGALVNASALLLLFGRSSDPAWKPLP